MTLLDTIKIIRIGKDISLKKMDLINPDIRTKGDPKMTNMRSHTGKVTTKADLLRKDLRSIKGNRNLTITEGKEILSHGKKIGSREGNTKKSLNSGERTNNRDENTKIKNLNIGRKIGSKVRDIKTTEEIRTTENLHRGTRVTNPILLSQSGKLNQNSTREGNPGVKESNKDRTRKVLGKTLKDSTDNRQKELPELKKQKNLISRESLRLKRLRRTKVHPNQADSQEDVLGVDSELLLHIFKGDEHESRC
jgi:hypothetical protein